MHKINVQTEYREQLKDRILNLAMQEFYVNGIKRVKMDDIAKKLVISKRTLYEIYNKKENLLLEGIKMSECLCENHMEKFQQEKTPDVMDILVEFYKVQMERVRMINPLFFVELHKYSKIVSYLNKQHELRRHKSQKFFVRGVRDGYFRDDIDYGLVERFSTATMEYVMDNKLYKIYSMQHILYNVMFLFMRGFCTDKGLVIMDMKIKRLK
ncbi:MAG: TetR/AcrR family transcriptional regulator [Prevotella sp.]|jgi:AcrR family transcriptional regulator|nr:TetR/AcrR family transcriptional regulator [Prevotella sp.]MBP7097388.1 TetR/AcrR family transcriptional regulator [Prevotella sp.]MBP8687065.1 TetR/AcrR family transcriptional regulator [Prevotella sp.]MBP8934461.1 TetR/AcrR family transcriptional regulator [Prevotella sp.]